MKANLAISLGVLVGIGILMIAMPIMFYLNTFISEPLAFILVTPLVSIFYIISLWYISHSLEGVENGDWIEAT